MEVTETSPMSVTLLKTMFSGLIFFSLLRNVYELSELNKLYDEIRKVPVQTKIVLTPWDNILMGLPPDDMELVGKLKSVLLPPPPGKYNFTRGEIPFKEHVLERAVRQLNMLHVEESKRGQIMYGSKYDGNPTLYCKDKRANKLPMEYEPWKSFEEKVATCDSGVISIPHRRIEHVGEICATAKEAIENIGQPRGFFVEVGAGDGENRSPTICLEIEDRWQGLLIEADPRFWPHLRAKGRKVSLGLACVGFKNTSYVGKLGQRNPTHSRLIEKWDGHFTELVEVNCYPLYTFFLAVTTTVVDFLVININGQELDVLKTLPWDKIEISIIAVCYGTKRERIELNDYLGGKGYYLYRRYHQDGESFLMFTRLYILD